MADHACSGISEFSESSVSSLFSHAGAVNFSEGCGCLLFFDYRIYDNYKEHIARTVIYYNLKRAYCITVRRVRRFRCGFGF